MRTEKIISIEETSFGDTDDYRSYDGFIIKTTDQVIKVGIKNGQSCCERWGILTTNDNISEFVGADIKSISLVDELLNKKEIEDLKYIDEGSTMFVNIETSNGTFQIVAYNSHNGYYGHEAVLISKQLNNSEIL